jgi:hypothetical protein
MSGDTEPSASAMILCRTSRALGPRGQRHSPIGRPDLPPSFRRELSGRPAAEESVEFRLPPNYWAIRPMRIMAGKPIASDVDKGNCEISFPPSGVTVGERAGRGLTGLDQASGPGRPACRWQSPLPSPTRIGRPHPGPYATVPAGHCDRSRRPQRPFASTTATVPVDRG